MVQMSADVLALERLCVSRRESATPTAASESYRRTSRCSSTKRRGSPLAHGGSTT